MLYALGLEIILVSGLVKFVPAVAYHFCLNLPATFSQPRTSIISVLNELYSCHNKRTTLHILPSLFLIALLLAEGRTDGGMADVV